MSDYKKNYNKENLKNKPYRQTAPSMVFMPVQTQAPRRPRELDYIITKRGIDQPRIHFTCQVCGCEYDVLRRKTEPLYSPNAADFFGDGGDTAVPCHLKYFCPNCGTDNYAEAPKADS